LFVALSTKFQSDQEFSLGIFQEISIATLGADVESSPIKIVYRWDAKSLFQMTQNAGNSPQSSSGVAVQAARELDCPGTGQARGSGLANFEYSHLFEAGEEVFVSEWAGKIALVTGGTSGIGRETALMFAKRGARVVIAGRRQKEGEAAVKSIRDAGGEALFVKTDVAKAAEVKALVEKTVEAFGGLDYAFNNAGIEGNWVPIVEQTEAEWDQTIDVNLKGTWLCLKFELQQMLKQGRPGAIVNNSSVAGFIGSNGTAIYSASKHGVLGLTKAAALEVAKNGIRVNAVCPAVIETPMADRLFGKPDVHERAISFHPIGRLGKTFEVAEAVLWMCSSGAGFMTGQSLVVDGGFLAGPPGAS
jgi:NAD(P)-dependent dehydrogenase (short-subunit alcohol dehydrogenase family)